MDRNWFDYPDIAFTNESLFVTFNMFLGDDWQRAVVFRFPLAKLAAAAALDYRSWTTTGNGSIRLCRGPGAVMYMGSHNNVSQLQGIPVGGQFHLDHVEDVNVRPWMAGAYSAPGPGGVNWLGRLDSRITGAWVGDGVIGLCGRRTAIPIIHCRIFGSRGSGRPPRPSSTSRISGAARRHGPIRRRRRTRDGVAGISACYGGGTRHPSHVVGIRTTSGWETQLSRTGTHSPPDQAWGDYLSCIAHHPADTEWVRVGVHAPGRDIAQEHRAAPRAASAVELDVAVRPVRGSELSRGSPPGAISSAWARRLHRTAARVYRCECRFERSHPMFTLISRLPIRELLYRQAPTLFGALVIAEMFYKWHSFLLEAAGFLLTWLVLDAVFGVIGKAIGVPAAADAER